MSSKIETLRKERLYLLKENESQMILKKESLISDVKNMLDMDFLKNLTVVKHIPPALDEIVGKWNGLDITYARYLEIIGKPV